MTTMTNKRLSGNDVHAARVETHCLMMQRLSECVDMAIQLHPEYDLTTLLGRAEMETFIVSRLTRLLFEKGGTAYTSK
jgi:hypothetical protein